MAAGAWTVNCGTPISQPPYPGVFFGVTDEDHSMLSRPIRSCLPIREHTPAVPNEQPKKKPSNVSPDTVDQSTNPGLRRELVDEFNSQGWLKKQMPHLLDSAIGVEAPASLNYNCIAHSVGKNDVWIAPPPSLADADDFFAGFGYVPSLPPTDPRAFALSAGIDKVVLFATESDGSVNPTHAIRQTCDGDWTSKNGQWMQVEVDSPLQMEGPAYGVAVRVYERYQRPGTCPQSPNGN